MKCKKMGLVIAITAITLLFSPVSTVKAAELSSEVKLSEVSGSCKDITEGILSNDSVAGDEEVDWFKFTPNESGEYAIYTKGVSHVKGIRVNLYTQKGNNIVCDKYEESENFDKEAQMLMFSYEMNAGESYYLAVDGYSSVGDNSVTNYGISVKKMSDVKSIKMEPMSKTVIMSEEKSGEVVNGYAETYFYGQLEYTDGLISAMTGELDNYYRGIIDEQTGLRIVGNVEGHNLMGNLYMDEKTYEDYSSYKPGTYPVKFIVSDYKENNYEGTTMVTVANVSEVYGTASDNYMGYTASLSYRTNGIATYVGSFYVESETTIAMPFSRQDKVYGFGYFYKVDKKGNIEKCEYFMEYDGTGMITLDKGKYYFQLIIVGEMENNQLVFGDPVARVKTTALSMDKSATVEVGSLVHLTDNLAVAPVDTTDSLVWSSDNTAVAEVSANGVVKGIAPGVANITVKSGDFSATCSVTVVAVAVKENPTVVTNPTVQNVQKVQFTKKSLSVKKGKSVKLSKYVKVNDKAKITFKKLSGNKNITVSKAGKLTVKKGLKKGTYKVKIKISANKTEKYSGASLTKTVKIKVK